MIKGYHTYRPLPPNTTIKESDVEGLGLFATQDIAAGKCIGITHIKNKDWQDGFIRTPIGGFVNHSETPNCKFEGEDTKFLFTIKPIESGEELLASYTLYKP
jgi:hypothetical protein